MRAADLFGLAAPSGHGGRAEWRWGVGGYRAGGVGCRGAHGFCRAVAIEVVDRESNVAWGDDPAFVDVGWVRAAWCAVTQRCYLY